MGHRLFLSLKQTLQFLQQIYVKNVMTIQYMALGFEPTTFRTRVSSNNHQTRAKTYFTLRDL